MQEQMLVQKEEHGQNLLEAVLQKCLQLLANLIGNPLLGSGRDERELFDRLLLQNLMGMQLLMSTDAAAKGMNPLRRGMRFDDISTQQEKSRQLQLREQLMRRMSSAPIVVPAPVYDKVAFAAAAVANEIRSSCKNDAKLEMKVMQEYLAELERQEWKTHDLMSPLLLILEDKDAQSAAGYDAAKPAGAGMKTATAHAEIAGKHQEPHAGETAEKARAGQLEYWKELYPDRKPPPDYGSAKPMGGSAKVEYSQEELQKYAQQLSAVDSNVAQLMRARNADLAEIRLISVREMLRHYFETNPKEFREIAMSLLGMVPSEGDEALMQRLSYEIARIGSVAFAYKMLIKLREKRKMGELVCVRNLGVQKGKRKKVLVCRRACGSAGMARGILELLIKKGSSDI